jgi:hypothetical protein
VTPLAIGEGFSPRVSIGEGNVTLLRGLAVELSPPTPRRFVFRSGMTDHRLFFSPLTIHPVGAACLFR